MVPHHSTDSAINCLTAQIGRDAVGLVVYGRNSKANEFRLFKYRHPSLRRGLSTPGERKAGQRGGRDLKRKFFEAQNI